MSRSVTSRPRALVVGLITSGPEQKVEDATAKSMLGRVSLASIATPHPAQCERQLRTMAASFWRRQGVVTASTLLHNGDGGAHLLGSAGLSLSASSQLQLRQWGERCPGMSHQQLALRRAPRPDPFQW
ncbi:hypothetical protein NDU88_012338 [Pleurodeles waltl]|uniref:Uncharacterized protein n=1 Tax=Pleurodeles waltl TaxID=8319 RepID=A0AAV7R0D2_PLEWA|nr:hypothetical protein NDU88_012338 [Pleurodeles waltl]